MHASPLPPPSRAARVATRLRRRGPMLRAAVVALALAAAAGPPPAASAAIELGAARLEFAAPRIDGHYGPRYAPYLACDLPLRWHIQPRIALLYTRGRRDLQAPFYAAAAESGFDFAAATFGGSYRLRVSDRLSFGAGPHAALAWVRERWNLQAPDADLESDQHGTRVWVAAGAHLEAQVHAADWGTFRLGYERLWGTLERERISGNAAGAASLAGGWSLVRVAWSPSQTGGTRGGDDEG